MSKFCGMNVYILSAMFIFSHVCTVLTLYLTFVIFAGCNAFNVVPQQIVGLKAVY